MKIDIPSEIERVTDRLDHSDEFRPLYEIARQIAILTATLDSINNTLRDLVLKTRTR